MQLERQLFNRSKALGLTTAALAEVIDIPRSRLEKVAVGYLDLLNDEMKHAWRVLDQLEEMIEAFAPFELNTRNPKALKIMLDRFAQGWRLGRPDVNDADISTPQL